MGGLRSLATQAGRCAARLGGIQRSLSAELNASVQWQGHDAKSFRADWETVHSQSMVRAVRGLEQLQRELTANADQQEAASGAGNDSRSTSSGAPSILPSSMGLPTPAELAEMSPQQVQDWWAGLDADSKAEFARSYPFEAGNTDGLPVADRIEANKVAAAAQLERIEANGASQGAEAGYLGNVVAGIFSLVAYDPANGNLIEMIGEYGQDTKTVLTYVPGTFAKAEGFYDGSAQNMARFLQESDPRRSTAAFVYKNSEFPQDQTFRLSADKEFGEDAGRKLAAFEQGLAAQNPEGALTVAVSHSWGEAAVSSSELHGAHYDRQISLSGAWMPDDWKANPATEYHHFIYDFDALTTAQQLGLVGESHPLEDPAFVKHIYDDPAENIEIGTWKFTANPAAKAENHGLIAEASDAKNRTVRNDIVRVIFGGNQ